MSGNRRPSGTTVISPDCPKCKGKGHVPLGLVAEVVKCSECGGTGKVTLERAGELFGLEPITRRSTPEALEAVRVDDRDTDPAPPIPRIDHRREPDE